MSKEPAVKDRLVALGYDLALMGVPEMFFLGPRRHKLVSGLKGPALVLEIGAGTGLSLQHYPRGVHVVATEPDVASIQRLAARAAKVECQVSAVSASAMRLPFPDATFDALACHLALCTIPDPDAALREARRVLKPGAPALFLEHVRSDGRLQSRLQDRLAPLWSRLAGGCRLNQDTLAIIRRSGLQVEHVERQGGALLPMLLVWACNLEQHQ